MRKLFGRFIPHHLTQANLDRRVDDSITLLTLHAGDRWLDRLITGDEKWVFYDNHHRKSQWVGEGESPQDVPKSDLHPKKVMLSVCWGVDGPIYWELLPEGKTITGDLYTTQLRNLKKAVDRSALKDKKVYSQHDNARPHVSKQVKQELMGYGWNVLPHPPYSPDLAPSEYWLFGDMSRAFEGRSFNSRGAVEAALKQYFASRPAGFYRNGIHKLRERWRHFENLLILDFNTTCEENNYDYPTEIIQVSVTVINIRGKLIREDQKFNRFVRPVISPVLSEYCSRITGIDKNSINIADKFPVVYDQFVAWLREHNFQEKYFAFVCEDHQTIWLIAQYQFLLLDQSMPAIFRQWNNIVTVFQYLLPKRNYDNLPGETFVDKSSNYYNIEFIGNAHNASDKSYFLAKIIESYHKGSAGFPKSPLRE
ncbi:hypothetical protein B9Z55_028109 [Caenorhabditis nigoni]|nr:hypothetical protein B9Z55_028109 [Caenorhabditis nigoni]